jgi:hypothetical protein
VALGSLVAGCGTPEITARWKDREITIDGDYRDWEGALYHFEDAKVYAGVLQDETHLYLCLSSSDRMRIQQVVRGGLTVWFDPSGNRTRSFGLRFPVGGAPTTTGMPPSDSTGGPRWTPGGFREGSTGIDVKKVLAQLTGADREIEIRRDSSPPLRLFLAEAAGIDVQIGLVEDVLTCELKIPLRTQPEYPYAVHTAPLQALSIGLETVAGPARLTDGPLEGWSGEGSPGDGPPDGEPPGGGRPGGGGPGGGGGGHRGGGRGGHGPGGGRPGSHGDMRRSPPAGPLDLWFQVKLVADAPK